MVLANDEYTFDCGLSIHTKFKIITSKQLTPIPSQVAPMAPITASHKRDKEVKLAAEFDDIPAEMYVPNQQLWLSLRARDNASICVKMASCCSWPY